MSQSFDQTDLHTDNYAMTPSSSTPANSDSNTNKKKVLAISAAAMLLGGAAWAIKQKTDGVIKKDAIPGDDTTVTPSLPTTQLPDDIDAAGKVNDTMSFEQAFEVARDEVGVGGVFGWHGHWYNTFEKEEWSSLSVQQRLDFTEMITQGHLPVEIYTPNVNPAQGGAIPQTKEALEPTIIEGHLNGQRVMGLDFDHDGIIDTLVMEGEDGYNYRVVDETGDEGLDTLYIYDSMDGELMLASKIKPTVISNEQFNQGLEASMSKEVVDSILEPDASVPTSPLPAPTEVHGSDGSDQDVNSDHDDNTYLASADEADDTYVNNGDVRDMDE
ncbi:hypothetical protein [Spirosoma flavum]|uniref:VCBS repeat-containing protein n=1 Tax=Spirosoma flavum TaxID=2048557 RepID=A0ABW6AT34_9BACT